MPEPITPAEIDHLVDRLHATAAEADDHLIEQGCAAAAFVLSSLAVIMEESAEAPEHPELHPPPNPVGTGGQISN